MSCLNTQANVTAKENDLSLEMVLSNLRSSANDITNLTNEMKNLNPNPEEFWYAMGSRLMRVRDEVLYRRSGCRSFADYCKRFLGYSRQHTYKLMKMVQFIDKVWAQAETPNHRLIAHRLFLLGFTKLYMVHSLPMELLTAWLEQGVPVRGWPDDSIINISLEMIKISELRRALDERGSNHSRRRASVAQGVLSKEMLITMLKANADALYKLILNNLDDSIHNNGEAERWYNLQHYAAVISQGINALTFSDNAKTAAAPVTAALIIEEGEESATLQLALARQGISCCQRATLAEARASSTRDFDWVILPTVTFLQQKHDNAGR